MLLASPSANMKYSSTWWSKEDKNKDGKEEG
jgi:hypothetical protein